MLCVLVLHASAGLPAHAGGDDEAGYPLPDDAEEQDALTDEFAFLEEASEVESAARHVQQIGMSPSAITVLTRHDIDTSGASTIPDLLRLVPGMDVLITCPFYPSVTTRIYWTNEGQHYLVLVDGREANVELLGFPPWVVQPIFLEDVERIEIIRGPGSSLYGANAMAGVISITTRAVGEGNSAWVYMSGGEAGDLMLGARASTRLGDWGFSLGGGGELAGSFNDFRKSAKKVWKLRAVAERRLTSSSRLLLDAGFAEGIGPFATAAGSIQSDVGLRTVRLAYESDSLQGQLYWSQTIFDEKFTAPLDFAGVRLARFMPFVVDANTLDAETQWNLPGFWDPLLLIAGGGGRFSWLSCDHCLNAGTYSDPASAGYHRPGVEHREWRLGAFFHAELAPVEWLTVTAGLRFDLNSETSEFLSPRGAVVFKPAEGQFIRLGVGRAFRKPAYLEVGGHMMVEFPDDSPITGTARYDFQEFVSRIVGNSAVDNEELLSFEVGYLGQFLDRRVTVTLDLYYNYHTELVELVSHIVTDSQGLPDLDQSYFWFANSGDDLDIFGSELSVRYTPTKYLSLVASWAHRQVFEHRTHRAFDETPKNLIALGGRFRTDWGLVGSLYGFSRSEVLDTTVENPAGVMEEMLTRQLGNVVLVLGRLGYRAKMGSRLQVELGVKLFFPVSPFSSPHFRFREKGGGVTPAGESYGGEELGRVVTGYLQGSY